MKAPTSANLPRATRLSVIGRVWIVAGCLLMAIAAGLFHAAGSPPEIPLSERQQQILAGEPHRLFYSARRWEELHHRHPLRRLPRHLGVAVMDYYLQLSPSAYAQTVARHIPFRVSHVNHDCDQGLLAAAAQVFNKPLSHISDAELSRLMKYSESPSKFPPANATGAPQRK